VWTKNKLLVATNLPSSTALDFLVHLGCGAASLWKLSPTFRSYIPFSYSRV